MAKDKIVAGTLKTRSESSDSTPLMLQYQKIKDEHKKEVLFFRLGDFYEMFNEDALEVSRLLNLTLTHRGTQPMCGIPYHAAKIYISRLLRLGKKIAVCEQVGENPNGKGLAERKVIEIITPGTALESEYLDGGANNFLAAASISGCFVGFAIIDVTTGEFSATHWKLSETAEKLPGELGRFNPREFLLSEKLYSNPAVKDILNANPSISISWYPDWNFDSKLSFSRLTRQFNTANLKSFSLTEESAEVGAAGFLLDYLQRNSTAKAPHVTGIKVYSDSEYVIIDDSSRRNLEITQNLRDGSTQYTLLECISNAKTSMGKRLLVHWLNFPLKNSSEIASRQDDVQLFFENSTLLEKIRREFSCIYDIERLAGRIAMEKAHGKDLQTLKNSLSQWLKIQTVLESFGFSFIDCAVGQEIIQLIDSSVIDEPSTSLTEGNLIKDGWSQELDHWKNIQTNFNQTLEEYAEEEKKLTGISNLRIKSNANSGYYIEITKGKLEKVPDHFIMRRSLVNAERYTTQKLMDLEKELLESAAKIIELEKELFIEVRKNIGTKIEYLLHTAKEIAYIDVVSSLADSAVIHNWTRPVVDDSTFFKLQDGRHPVVEHHLPHGEFVPNDLFICSPSDFCEDCSTSFDLITGPNMAGKSTFLRQNALISLLAQTGSFVPAENAHLGIVDRIFCRVGASDNLARGESTFLVEMTETANILRSATQKSLVIMDEVGRGTSTEDGLSIAWAISEYLLNTIKCRTLFATHYHELTRMIHPALKLQCMAVSETQNNIVFLRKIKDGASENSYGLHVASLAGVPSQVIDRAKQILSKLQETAGETLSVKIETSLESQKKSVQPVVPGLFSDEELILDEILSCDVENITPIQALTLVSRWKKSLSGR